MQTFTLRMSNDGTTLGVFLEEHNEYNVYLCSIDLKWKDRFTQVCFHFSCATV